jgi:hypothetical protein
MRVQAERERARIVPSIGGIAAWPSAAMLSARSTPSAGAQTSIISCPAL